MAAIPANTDGPKNFNSSKVYPVIYNECRTHK